MQKALSGLVLCLLFASSSASAALLSCLSGQASYDTGGVPTGGLCDIAAVPVPGAVWLFGSALAVMGALRRRATRR